MSEHRAPLFSRVLRGSALTAGSYAISQALRLASNLILARLLFPEAFGLMALVSVFLVGLAMFSDVGIGPAISQSPRGDEPDFLNTAWTVQVLRGVILWLATCALAWPAARVYDAPELLQLLPVAGLTLLLASFNPTRIDTANRHLLLGRLTALDLTAQIIGIVAMVVLAAVMRSVWALVIGALIGTVAKLTLTHFFLPGERNRFRWEPSAGRDLVNFGKWIFLSTACGFLLSQGDKAILGAYLRLDELGIYNIGYFLASFPVLLGGAVTGRILIPIYRDHPPAANAENAMRLRRLRYTMTGGMLALLGLMGFVGQPLVGLLYDDRYLHAGIILVAIACVQLPQVIGMTYDQSALAAGDSRTYFIVMALRAGLQSLCFWIGASSHGLEGALIGQFLAILAAHPIIIWLARRHNAWDPRHDLLFGSLATLLLLAILWWNWAGFAQL
ncbi:oligosaccharide flippase family protein [Gemmobacter serpentinus]|uniref:oligosaccharide flippase family protein n=1 Tax=Gemmobacter serpentinus TaxID=2652247 RepID=UPI00124CD775|nr:oligosaccharide flippase family protein [Gemmobacter serpentinus]